MSVDDRLGRRALMRGVACGVALAAFPVGCGGLPGPVSAGSIASLPSGALRLVDGENVFLGRDEEGLYAMSAICTHQGAAISAPATTAAVVVCPRHLSMFDRNGAVLRGPASQPLQHYRVDVAPDGAITIQVAQPVSSTARTPVG
jgi:nitrite reductase/ring-hydroxylating ferredoxin subunit